MHLKISFAKWWPFRPGEMIWDTWKELCTGLSLFISRYSEVGLLYQFPLFGHFPSYCESWKQWLPIKYPFEGSDIRFYNIGNIPSGEANERKLSHWGRVAHICVSKLNIIASDNGLSPDRWQAIIWTTAGILFIGLLGTHFSEILIEIYTSPFKKMHVQMLSAKRRPFCLGVNVLRNPHSWFCHGTDFTVFIRVTSMASRQ